MIADVHLVTYHKGQERVHVLRYNNAALYRLTRETKIGDPLVYFQELFQGKAIPIPSQADIVDLIWAGLLHRNRGATIDVALQIFDELPGDSTVDKIGEVFQQIAEAIFKAMGQDLSIEPESAAGKPQRTEEVSSGTDGNVSEPASSVSR